MHLILSAWRKWRFWAKESPLLLCFPRQSGPRRSLPRVTFCSEVHTTTVEPQRGGKSRRAMAQCTDTGPSPAGEGQGPRCPDPGPPMFPGYPPGNGVRLFPPKNRSSKSSFLSSLKTVWPGHSSMRVEKEATQPSSDAVPFTEQP